MSLVEEDAINNPFNGLIEWCIFKDDICTFAAEFKSEPLTSASY